MFLNHCATCLPQVLITEFSEDDSNQSPHLGGGGFKASDSIGDMGSDDRDSDTDTDLDSCIEADIDDAEQYDTDLEIDGDGEYLFCGMLQNRNYLETNVV